MITKISFKFPYELKAEQDTIYDYGAVRKALKDLESRMNRKDFKVFSGVLWDDDPTCGVGEELSVGETIGNYVTVICDDMFENLVKNEVSRTRFVKGYVY